MTNLVSKEYYDETYSGVLISDCSEFEKLSARAEALIDSFVQSEVPNWNYDQYTTLKSTETTIKTAICQEIEVLYQSNGMQAVTGGADAGSMELFGGVPFSKMAKENILLILQKNNIRYGGI